MSYTVREIDTNRARTFRHRDNAVAFAKKQANAAWIDTSWTVTTGDPDVRISVSREGFVTAYRSGHRIPVQEA